MESDSFEWQQRKN
jgi:apolipoprotein D and lipocalin family protein